MIIPIAEFQSKDKTVTISVEKVDTCYYYLTDRGDRSMRYNNLSHATAPAASDRATARAAPTRHATATPHGRRAHVQTPPRSPAPARITAATGTAKRTALATTVQKGVARSRALFYVYFAAISRPFRSGSVDSRTANG